MSSEAASQAAQRILATSTALRILADSEGVSQITRQFIMSAIDVLNTQYRRLHSHAFTCETFEKSVARRCENCGRLAGDGSLCDECARDPRWRL